MPLNLYTVRFHRLNIHFKPYLSHQGVSSLPVPSKASSKHTASEARLVVGEDTPPHKPTHTSNFILLSPATMALSKLVKIKTVRVKQFQDENPAMSGTEQSQLPIYDDERSLLLDALYAVCRFRLCNHSVTWLLLTVLQMKLKTNMIITSSTITSKPRSELRTNQVLKCMVFKFASFILPVWEDSNGAL